MDCWQVPLSIGFSRQEYKRGLHTLLQRIFPTQGLNLGLLHCRRILYHLSHPRKPIPEQPTLQMKAPLQFYPHPQEAFLLMLDRSGSLLHPGWGGGGSSFPPHLDTGNYNTPRELPLLWSRTAKFPALSEQNKIKPPAQAGAGAPRSKRWLIVTLGLLCPIVVS